MASIPHGTMILAQSVAPVLDGRPPIVSASIAPFLTALPNNPTDGGTANTAFLQGAGGPDVLASLDTAIFWIKEVAGTTGQPDFVQNEYKQTVFLDFNGVRWPHGCVATLRKVAPAIG